MTDSAANVLIDHPAEGVIRLTLNRPARLNALTLELVDESEKHRGHAGWRPGGGTHFAATVPLPPNDATTTSTRDVASGDVGTRTMRPAIPLVSTDGASVPGS